MANQDTTHRPGRQRIDWHAAKAFYLALDHPRSYGDVARHFGVSDTAVRNHAIGDTPPWKDLAADVDARANTGLVNGAVLSRQERVKKALRIVDGLLGVAEAQLPRLGQDLKPSDLPAIVKLAELLEGEATDRVAIGEVQVMFSALIGIAGRWVASELPPAERRQGFLAELETATAGLELDTNTNGSA